jgi:hypothetical protein
MSNITESVPESETSTPTINTTIAESAEYDSDEEDLYDKTYSKDKNQETQQLAPEGHPWHNSKCEGCRMLRPDQESHMGFEGCLSDTITQETMNVENDSDKNQETRQLAPEGHPWHNSKCEGCRMLRPDQESHMGFEGCLSDEQ